jgi:hypothetical protein
MGPGAAFFDFDRDGYPDLAVVQGAGWAGSAGPAVRLYRNNGRGAFVDVSQGSGLESPLFGLGLAAADFDNDGLIDLYVTAYGQNRLYKNLGDGRFQDITQKAGLGGRRAFSTSAVWFDYDRDGYLDLFVCNYVQWTPETDIFCTIDGKRKSYCTPEAYPGSSCWLFRNRGNGTFEDVTVKAGLLDVSSKALGVTVFDYDGDGWLDLFVANDTQPNKLYRNQRNGTFKEIAVQAGVAFSDDGKARAGMGADSSDIDGSGRPSLLVTNFQNEMLGLYRLGKDGAFVDQGSRGELGKASRNSLGFGCFFFDPNLDGRLDLLVANGHIDETVAGAKPGVTYAQAPQLFLNEGEGRFRDVASVAGSTFAAPKVARGACRADIDLDGDEDILITSNGGPCHLYRNDVDNGNRSIRIILAGTQSNRDGIGAVVEVYLGDRKITGMVKSGSSYLSQSELPLTMGLGASATVDRLVIRWPSGRVEEHKRLLAGRAYTVTESKGITSRPLAAR